MTKLGVRGAFAALLAACFFTAACGDGATSRCSTGYAYCRDPGGNGADLCCPVASPYYCATDNGCHSTVFFTCASGKVFCSTEYN
jgi:hypothetical protein